MHDPNILNHPAMTNRSRLEVRLAGPSGGDPPDEKGWTLSVKPPGKGPERCAGNGTCSATVSLKTPITELKKVGMRCQTRLFSLLPPPELIAQKIDTLRPCSAIEDRGGVSYVKGDGSSMCKRLHQSRADTIRCCLKFESNLSFLVTASCCAQKFLGCRELEPQIGPCKKRLGVPGCTLWGLVQHTELSGIPVAVLEHESRVSVGRCVGLDYYTLAIDVPYSGVLHWCPPPLPPHTPQHF